MKVKHNFEDFDIIEIVTINNAPDVLFDVTLMDLRILNRILSQVSINLDSSYIIVYLNRRNFENLYLSLSNSFTLPNELSEFTLFTERGATSLRLADGLTDDEISISDNNYFHRVFDFRQMGVL